MPTRVIGILLFLAAAAVAVGVSYYAEGGGVGDPLTGLLGERQARIEPLGFVGGEKENFLANPEVREILEDDFRIVLQSRRAGSLEMVQDPQILGQSPSVLWPSSQVALEIARAQSLKMTGSEIIFNSPIVLYSWRSIAEALVEAGLARPLGTAGTAFSIDFEAFLRLILENQSWSSIGVDQLYDGVRIYTTDPARSNSGNQAAALMVQLLADGAASGPTLEQSLDQVAQIYATMGLMETSSGNLFRKYLEQGMGSNPMIAGYENQLIEFVRENPERWQAIAGRADRPVILYPEPTVFSSHVLIALDEDGRRVAQALLDPRLQEIAWTAHGFRTGLATGNDPAQLGIDGLPDQVAQVVPMPPFRVIQAMLERIERAQRGD